MNISGMISGLKQRVRDREERKAKAVSAEYEQLKKESTVLKMRAEVYQGRVKEQRNLSQLKREVRVAKIQSNPLGRIGLAVASQIKENIKNKDKKKEGMSFLPSGKDHPLFRK